MESLPLHEYRVQKWTALIHRSHTIFHSIAIIAIIYYRLASYLNYINDNNNITIPLIPWLLIFSSELSLAFLWLLSSAYGWRPISRTVYPERLPPDTDLPGIDVFICTADPKKEPPLGVMNTVISAMGLDYPPDKLSVYLSDDGSSSLTLFAIQEAWNFAEKWIPFCRKYKIKNRCPEAYFTIAFDDDDGDNHVAYQDFQEERENIEREYKKFKERLEMGSEKEEIKNITGGAKHEQTHHLPKIQMLGNRGSGRCAEMPSLVYVSREKKSSYPHHFKAGALNVLLRVSATLSNSPYILVLDCDMNSNDPSSARQAMCFHLDQNISPSLAFVQFPQNFHNISKNDIYGSALRYIFGVRWPGMDGLQGPMLSGTGFYMKRKALYGSHDTEKDKDLTMLRKSFGLSNEFIKSINSYGTVKNEDSIDIYLEEAKLVASCTYEDGTQWGKQIGFLYDSVVEDYFTGLILHCRGWTSVFCNPSKPAFLGTATTSLNETLVQGTRWNSGLLEVFLSKSCPLIYGLRRMPLLECMCYAYFASQPLYCSPIWCLAIVPQLCLLKSIPVYPEVSSPWFMIYLVVFVSSLAKHLWEVLRTGGTLRAWWNELRVWMIKSITAYFYGSLDAILKLVGIAEARFMPTNKVANDEQLNRYQLDIFDFQPSSMLLIAPLVTLLLLNMVSFIWGTALVTLGGLWKELFGQIFLSIFILIVNWPIVEGFLFRKDKGRIHLRVTLFSVAASVTVLSLNAFLFM